MNFKCFKTVILGTLSLVLLKLSLLGVSRHTPSSYMLIAHSNDIKLIWWHLGIGRSMGLIMRKDSPLWLKWLLSTLLRPLLFSKGVRFIRCIFTWWPKRRNLYVSYSWFFFFYFYWGLSFEMVSIWFEVGTTGMVWEVSYYSVGFYIYSKSIWLLFIFSPNYPWDHYISCVCWWCCDYWI